jgi:hypothetical protein
MSVENHRHCQATVLGATGTPAGSGKTWSKIATLELPNIARFLNEDWLQYFTTNENVTEDLAGILILLNKIAGEIQPVPPSATPLPGDIIEVSPDERTVNVRNSISQGYTGLVGFAGTGDQRRLTECNVSVVNTNSDGPTIATLTIGNRTFEIKALNDYQPPQPPQPPVEQERYVITEDRDFDIVLSGGENDNCPLDYTDELRYVVTENGHEHDIGVSGYGDSVLLNYSED